MEKVFKSENGTVTLLKEELSLIPEFKALLALSYNRQPGDLEGRKRQRAEKEFQYIWFMLSPRSPYREYNTKEREEEVFSLLGMKPKDCSNELLAAMKKYEELNYTRVMRLITSAEGAVDKLRGYYDTLQFTEKTTSGSLVNRPTEVINSLSQLEKVATALTKLAYRQQHEDGRIVSSRGEQEIGWQMEEEEQNDFTQEEID